MATVIKGFNTDTGIAKYDYNSLANLPDMGSRKDGADGLSAYDVAKKNGFDGTETEWLASLKGKDGANGKDGTDGKDGVDGVGLSDDEKQKVAMLGNTVEIVAGQGIERTISAGKATFGVQKAFIHEMITSILKRDFPELFKSFDVIRMTTSAVPDCESNDWYDLANFKNGWVKFAESDVKTAPEWASTQFRDKAIPAYRITFSQQLNLMKTPVLNVKLCGVGQIPFEFRFVDAAGKKSNSIVLGTFAGLTVPVINIDSATYQTTAEQAAAGVSSKIEAIKSGPHYNYTTKPTNQSALNSQLAAVLADRDETGAFRPDEFGYLAGAVDVLNGMLSGFGYEDGFDCSNIVGMDVQHVEWSDKSAISWKARYKAIVFGLFEFCPASFLSTVVEE